eukprot:TRINITY_DN3396_c0_g1_i8.p1 TRINITY_DN3396_c0_g1~~TRINITY_DN3396_c0_g1_i8.p1  ORF type:complete len:640 (+),score=115.59 TRINITY_DN3396_c0_g1_i8:128-2047(+)
MIAEGKSSKQRSEELVQDALLGFKTEVRVLIKRDLDMAVKELQTGLKQLVLTDLGQSMKKEFSVVMKQWNSTLKGDTGAGIRNIVKEELEASLKTAIPQVHQANTDQASVRPAFSPVVPLSARNSGAHRKVGTRKRSLLMARSSGVSTGHEPRDVSEDSSHTPLLLDKQSQDGRSAAPSDVSRELGILPNETQEASGPKRTFHLFDLRGEQLEENGNVTKHTLLENFITSEFFEVCISVIIVLNAIVIGLSTDYSSRFPGSPDPLWSTLADLFFFILFAVEILLRLFVYRMDFFFNSNATMWNWFDFLLVVMQILDATTQCLPNGVMSLRSFRALRSIKLIRILRLLRVFRLVRFITELRTVFAMFGNSLRSLVGSLLLLLLVLFLFGVCFTDTVADAKGVLLMSGDSVAPDVDELFGSLARTMMCLFESVTGGLSWTTALKVFDQVGVDYMIPVFVAYIFFVVFAVMNVVTGIVVSQAMETVQKDQDAIIVKNIDLLFKKGDLSCGDITRDEFDNMSNTPEMFDIFKAINIDPSQSSGFFNLLDTEGVGIIDYMEFTSGCLKLRGNAKALDLYHVTREHHKLQAFVRNRLSTVSAKVKMLCDRLLPPEEDVSMVQVFSTDQEESDGEGPRDGNAPAMH